MNQYKEFLNLICVWDLPYHTGMSLGLLGQYCHQGKICALEEALKHLIQEFSNTYLRGRKDCEQSLRLSPEFSSQNWSFSRNIEGALSCFRQIQKSEYRLHYTEKAIKLLQAELALFHGDKKHPTPKTKPKKEK